ncbi:MAG: PsbP-related protein [Nitrososphaeraceae archaeon]
MNSKIFAIQQSNNCYYLSSILFLMFVVPNGNNIRSYGQMLDKAYINENCGVSIHYPSDWKLEEKTLDDATRPVNYIVEFQPNNDEGSTSIVGIELDDISHLSDRSLEAIRTSEEHNITLGGIGIIETSETISVAGHDAQKIVYTVPEKTMIDLRKWKSTSLHLTENIK